jgi:ParB-like chromosome segregation protein Spo0J
VSLAADPNIELDDLYQSIDLSISWIQPGEGVRSGGLDERHVLLLMETADQWPPIVVWGEQCRLIDGAHRVEAARRLGLSTIAAVRFLGTADEAFVESVRRNVEHGLPLPVVDRRRAALRVLRRHGEWSDRRVGFVCGLSGKTIARMRREHSMSEGRCDGVVLGMDRRVGRDGKARPVQSGEVRERIKRALEENPGGSLRVLAAMAGASPETVRTVRARLAGHDRPPSPTVPFAPAAKLHSVSVDSSRVVPLETHDQPSDVDDWPKSPWKSDPALLACGDGGDFAKWFEENKVGDDWRGHVWNIPLGRIYEVVDEARRRAAAWTSFASVLESRTR